jgi:hypothetical protein
MSNDRDATSSERSGGRLDDEQLVRHAVSAARPHRLWVEVVTPRPVPNVRARRLQMHHLPRQVDELQIRFRRRIHDVLVTPSAPTTPSTGAEIDDAITAYMAMRADELDFDYWANNDIDHEMGDVVHWWELLGDPYHATAAEQAAARADAAIANGMSPLRSTAAPTPGGGGGAVRSFSRGEEGRASLERPAHQTDPPTPSPSRPGSLDHVSDGPSAAFDDRSIPAAPAPPALPPPIARSATPGRVDRDELLARVDLEALLDSVAGRADCRRRWHCPERDHTDEHPSVSMHISADGVPRWRCWSGGHGGTAIDVVVGARGVDAGEAMRWLAEHHTSLPVAEHRPAPPPVAQLGHPDPAVARYATQASKLLWTAAGRPQRDWLAARGLGPEVLRANAVGADPGRRLLARPKGPARRVAGRRVPVDDT